MPYAPIEDGAPGKIEGPSGTRTVLSTRCLQFDVTGIHLPRNSCPDFKKMANSTLEHVIDGAVQTYTFLATAGLSGLNQAMNVEVR